MHRIFAKDSLELLYMFLSKDLRERYVGSAMGFYWSLINPLVLLGLYYFVFSVILDVDFSGHNAALFIFSGMLPFLTFQETLQRSVGSVAKHANLIKKVIFPSEILALYIGLSGIANELAGILILVLLAAAVKGIGFALLFLPVVLLFQLLFTVGLAWILTTLNVYFPDIAHLLGVVLLVWLFLTPVFYPETFVPERYRLLVVLNPMAHLVGAYRSLILLDTLPLSTGFSGFCLISIALFAAGYYFYRSRKLHFGDII